MAISWFLLEILSILFYKNLHEFAPNEANIAAENEVNETTPISINNEPNKSSYNSISETADNDDVESNALLGSKDSESIHSKNGFGPIRVIDNAEAGPFIVRFYNEYIRDEMVAVLAATFMVFFMQTCLEV